MDGNLNKDLDDNLAGLTQKTEDPKSNKGNLTFPTHTVNVIELNCKIIKKVAIPPFLHQPPSFSGLSCLSSKKFRTPPSQVTQSLEDPTPHPPLMRGRQGGGGSNHDPAGYLLDFLKGVLVRCSKEY